MKFFNKQRYIALILFFLGIGVMSYPYLSELNYQLRANKRIEQFDEEIKINEVNKEDNVELYKLKEEMQKYNEWLFETKQSELIDVNSYEEPSFELNKWGIESNIFGYIDIPEIDVRLPIFLGASSENMKLGAVHLTNTSLPIGGVNTNTVIAAHRGYSKAKMFREITNLSINSKVYITNPWNTLTYKVVHIDIIDPTEVDKILIQEGKELLTLFTCYPYRISNKRYMIYCARIE